MEHFGFIRDMMDVKVLILFVAARLNYPVSIHELYEICYQDESLSYFDVCTAAPQMVESGHLAMVEDKYVITEKGRADGAVTENSVAYTVRSRAELAIARFNRNARRSSFVKTQIISHDSGDQSVMMALDDDQGNLMTLELMAPDVRQAKYLSDAFRQKAEILYNMIMTELLDET